MPFPPGATVGAYRIISSIGAGGMGEVYRAHDARLGRDVALKLLPDAMASDPAARERFEREARAVAALSHPHIVTIYSTEQDGEVRFLTMELVEGRTLAELIPSAGLEIAAFFDVAIALADALRAAHSKHITHRDLKPSNVMVTDDGRVKVLDFGLATATAPQVSADAVTSPPLTHAGMLIGTVPYMSPEQVEGKAADHRSDLFALGIVLYEMGGGRRPFGGDSSAALMSAILRDQPKPLADVRPSLPGAVSQLVARCLEKSPRDRIQSADEVLADLKAARKAFESGAATTVAPAPAALVESIAVLAFRDMSPARDQEWFCDGIAEEILNALSSLPGLKVAARASAFSFKGKNESLTTIGEKLNVSSVLEGSVRRAGDRVRITVQLNQVSDGFQLWSERYDRDMRDIFDVQDEIARAIAERLRVTLADGGGRLVPKATANIAAYEVYLQGRALLYRRGQSVALALQKFQKAVELDPEYALAWAGIADVFTVFGYYGAARPDNVRPLALDAAKRAVACDPQSAEAHTALGGTLLFYEGDRDGAVQEFETALALNPNYVQCLAWYSLFCLQWACGRIADGLARARHMHHLDPLSHYTLTVFGFALGAAQLHDEAIDVTRRAAAADPESFITHFAHGATLSWSGRHEEAAKAYGEGLRRSNDMTFMMPWCAVALADCGRVDEARQIYNRMVDRGAKEYVSPASLAMAAMAAGEREAALVLMRRAWETRDPLMLAVSPYHPDFQWFWKQDELRDIVQIIRR